jgi:very-short-patch-repair endonuclease
VPTPAQVPDELRSRPFRGSDAVRSGLITPRRLAGASWRRIFHDVYVHRDVPESHGLRAVAASILLPGAVVSGVSAATLWGLDVADPSEDVEVTLPPASHMVRVLGIRARRARLIPGHVLRLEDASVTSPAATSLRLADSLPVERAVAAVDQLVVSRRADLHEIRALAASATGPGSARARRVAALVDGLAESPQETRVRLLILRSHLPDPVAQYRVVVDGRFVARVDFAWPERKVALEYDGLWHAEPGQFARDRERLNRLREAGWTVVFVTAADLRDPDRLLARMAAALV